MRTNRLSLLPCILLAGLLSGLPVAADEAPAIAVASSLRTVWPTLASAWRTDLPDLAVRASFGASNTLARQIARGAPFELFLAADDTALAYLPGAATDGRPPVSYATGRLALVLRNPSTGTAAPGNAASGPLETLAARMDAEPTLRIALPNPDHAPYGRAAREVLEHAGLWPIPDRRLVRGENASQTLQFLLSGAVDAALLPYSLVVEGRADEFDVQVIDAVLHGPLTHPLVVLTDASPAARELAAWLQSPRAREILAAAGFDAPP